MFYFSDECASNPCSGNSTCEDKLNDFICHCQPGFTGKTCSININECEGNPCENGKCIDKVNDFECDCEDTGFFGDLCQNNEDDCEDDSCTNGGTCIDGVKGFNCSCYPGYEGQNCGIDTDECALLPCTENQGHCFQKSNQSLYDLVCL